MGHIIIGIAGLLIMNSVYSVFGFIDIITGIVITIMLGLSVMVTQSRSDDNHLFNLQKYIDEILGEVPEYLSKKQVKSINQLKNDFKMGSTRIKNFLKSYLTQKYGPERAEKIWFQFWGSTRRISEIKKRRLFEILDTQLKNYPEDINSILSIGELAKITGFARKSVAKWVLSYLKKNHGPIKANQIYNKIWSSRNNFLRRVTIQYIQSYISHYNASLITTESEWNDMTEDPCMRYIHIKCKEHSKFSIRVNDMLYRRSWCPSCIIRYCQEMMRKDMDLIFGYKFLPMTLRDAFDIDWKEGGNLRFDGYCGEVIIKGYWFRIAFEYDGEQHDLFPNAFHRNYWEFTEQQGRDKHKNRIAEEHNVIIIRLKSINGFDRQNIKKFHNEIIRQFNSHTLVRETGIKLPLKTGSLDKFLGDK